MNNIIINYIAPLMITTSGTNYIIHKTTEKRIINSVKNMELGKREIQKQPNEIPEELKKLVIKLEQYTNKQNLNNLYHNLNDVTINKNWKMLLFGISGKYNTEKNTLDYSIEGSIEHEFLHLASSFCDYNNNIKQCGFINYNSSLTIGRSLNEGYTDFLSREIFNKKTKFYNDEVRIAHFLQLLIGKEQMDNFYFNNDLKGLVTFLSNYINENEVIKLIMNMDLALKLKKLSNPIYKIIYNNIELQLCELFEKHNTSLLKQIDFIKLVDNSLLTKCTLQLKKTF